MHIHVIRLGLGLSRVRVNQHCCACFACRAPRHTAPSQRAGSRRPWPWRRRGATCRTPARCSHTRTPPRPAAGSRRADAARGARAGRPRARKRRRCGQEAGSSSARVEARSAAAAPARAALPAAAAAAAAAAARAVGCPAAAAPRSAPLAAQTRPAARARRAGRAARAGFRTPACAPAGRARPPCGSGTTCAAMRAPGAARRSKSGSR
mmetsp:Transcript_51175/g.165279  ORF Transcript_51175/g.165279 Transcript_51175/m.165279 type:complete len:208 (+) Transcript_51175:105-728(+)